MQYKAAHQIHARAWPLSPSSRQQVGALGSMYENGEARELSVGRLGGLEQHGIIAYIREQFQLPRAYGRAGEASIMGGLMCCPIR